MPLPSISSKSNGISSGDRGRDGGATSILTEKTDGNTGSGGNGSSGSNEDRGGGTTK